VLVVCIAGILGVTIGLSQTQQFRVKAESAEAFEVLASHYSTGTSNPTTVVARTSAAADVLAATKATPGVVEAAPTGASSDGWTYRVVLDAAPPPPTPTASSPSCVARFTPWRGSGRRPGREGTRLGSGPGS
jgi:RND superfamily putative drug exporter